MGEAVAFPGAPVTAFGRPPARDVNEAVEHRKAATKKFLASIMDGKK